MKSFPICLLFALLASLCLIRFGRADYPKPSPYPISWELKFDHDMPQRIVVKVPGVAAQQAYWYMTYTVTNNTGQEQTFLPFFEMLTSDGRVIHSDNKIPAVVFNAIKQREKKNLMEPWTKIGGELLLGADQAKDGVAIWQEPMLRMGHFSIFIAGLSGEAVRLKDDGGNEMKDKDGKPIILRKTLQLNFHVRGDDVYPGEDEVNANPERWVMR
jgi:hypothetical protein